MFPKPEPLARTRRRKVRVNASAVQALRALVFTRDGERCAAVSRLNTRDALLLMKHYGVCGGVLELAHLAGHRRSQTRGREPAARHDSRFCLALCTEHHRAEESAGLRFLALTDAGMDGDLTWAVQGAKA